MLYAFGHPVAMCCDMLPVENRTIAHAHSQRCWTNLAKQLEHQAPAKRSQHFNATYGKVTLLGATCCVRLATLLRRVATCWVLLAQI